MPLIIPGNRQASTGYTIDQSIRFNGSTGYLSKSISSTSSRTTWTFSTWFKLGNSGINSSFTGLFSAVLNSSNFVNIALSNSSYGIDFLLYNSGSTLGRLNATRLLRDPSAWYHLVAVLDTTNAVASERMRLYINGVRETSFTTESHPSKDSTPIVNYASTTHNLGRAYNSGTYSGYYYDGYMAEIHLLDGYAYDPSFFGEFNDSGIWIPKEYDGSYGTNGFKIDGRDSSDLGDDESGNGNDYSASGIGTYDQVLDSPTNNFAVINVVKPTTGTGTTVENGNLFQQSDSYSSTNYGYRPSTLQPLNSGKWYFEFEPNNENGGGNVFFVGITGEDTFNTSATSSSVGSLLNPSYGMYCYPNPSGGYLYFFYEGSSRQETNAPIPVHGNIIGVAVDFDNAKIYFFVNGTEVYGQNISAGTAATNLSGWSTSSNWIINFYTATASNNAARGNITFNFGQDSSFYGVETPGGNSDGNGIGNFKYSVPSGFLALCTKNLGS